MSRKRTSDVVTTPWFIRLAIYILVAGAGLAGVITGWTTPEAVDGWLSQVGSVSALVGGLLASLNVTRDTKENGEGEEPPASAPAPAPPAVDTPVVEQPDTAVGNALLDQMRDQIAQNRM